MNREQWKASQNPELTMYVAGHPLGKFLRGRVPIQVPAWPAPQGELAADKAPVPLPRGMDGEGCGGRPQSLTPFGEALERALLAVCDALIAAAPELDILDSRHVTAAATHMVISILQIREYFSSAGWSACATADRASTSVQQCRQFWFVACNNPSKKRVTHSC